MDDSPTDENAEGSEPESVSLPITVPAEVAAEILEELEAGRSVAAELDPELTPHLAERIRWQLEHGKQVTELVSEYDGE